MYREILFLASLMAAATAPDYPRGPARASSFQAEIRGDLSASASGEAGFGPVHTVDQSSAAFVVSLGICGEQSAILFTRGSEVPLTEGRYRISSRASGTEQVSALVLTGSPSHPTGVFPGESGWLIVTGSSDRLMTGRFQFDATGFLAAEPQREGRRVNVTGSFSATPAGSSFQVCQDAK
jgi:hypothetical protein